MVGNPMKRIIAIISSLLLTLSASAQFYVTGDDPGHLKWYSIDSDNFRIIYPEGNDSLARVYGQKLEHFRPIESLTSGYNAGGQGKHRMPVVLHSWNTSNGSVAWAPRRMDLFGIPSAYEPEALPWETMLAVHESRHVTQMQFAMTQSMRPFNWFLGEMFNVAASIIYPGISTMEGDAVIMETAYSPSGRGRTSDFLNYYRVAFDEGVRRDWAQWRCTSQRNYNPNYYALGYLTIGGLRHFYNCPDYMARGYRLAASRPYRLDSFQSIAKEVSGKRKYNEMFQEIADNMTMIWKAEADARAPYIPMEVVSKEPRLYTDYTSNIFIGNDLYSIKKGFLDTPVIVRVDEDGKESRVSSFASQAGRIRFEGKKMWWSETVADVRWTMQADSKVRFLEGELRNGKAEWSADKTFKTAGRLLHNPAPSPDGSKLACVEYFVEGGSAVTILEISQNNVSGSYKAPAGMQVVECAWVGEDLYVTAITDEGYGIYRVEDGAFMSVLAAQPVMIKDFGSYGNELMFTCDRTGVNELYHLDTQSLRLIKKTSIRHGGESFTYSSDGKWLYFSSQTVKGKRIYRTAVSDLLNETADFTKRHKYLLAESLAEQEREAASRAGLDWFEKDGIYGGDKCSDGDEVSFSEPRRYRKFPNMFNVHSWTPFYVNVDNIMNMSFDNIYEAVSLGAAGIIQNALSTATGEFGYSAHKDPYNPSKWRHSGHARLTYSGLYPILEAKVDINDRAARQYNMNGYLQDNGTYLSLTSRELSTPSVQARFRAYIPFNFSSGGWFRGLIPQVSYSISNDYLNNSLIYYSTMKEDGYQSEEIMEANGMEPMEPIFVGARYGKTNMMQYATASLRAYTMLGTSNSAVYPRWGIGAEVGGWANVNGRAWFSPMGYAYLYGYVPGILRSHGIKLSALYQGKLTDAPFGQNVADVMPRGFKRSTALSSALGVQREGLLKLSADYAFPVYIGDISILNSFLFIKRLTITPHFDYMMLEPFRKKGTAAGPEGLWSAGCNLGVNLESTFWIKWPCVVGLTASFNGGPSMADFIEKYKADRYFVGPTFSVSF